jgi:hypothetical protein
MFGKSFGAIQSLTFLVFSLHINVNPRYWLSHAILILPQIYTVLSFYKLRGPPL